MASVLVPESDIVGAIIGARILDPRIVDGKIVDGRIVGGRVVDATEISRKAVRARKIDIETTHAEVIAVIALVLTFVLMYLI